jgi:hypothetical protein
MFGVDLIDSTHVKILRYESDWRGSSSSFSTEIGIHIQHMGLVLWKSEALE